MYINLINWHKLCFQTQKRQTTLALELFSTLIAHGDLKHQELHKLAVNLWHLAQKHSIADQRHMVSISNNVAF